MAAARPLQATLGELAAKRERSTPPRKATVRGKFGMSVQPLTPDLAEEAGVPAARAGVIVTDLDPSGIAADSGIQEGDVIEKVDGRP